MEGQIRSLSPREYKDSCLCKISSEAVVQCNSKNRLFGDVKGCRNYLQLAALDSVHCFPEERKDLLTSQIEASELCIRDLYLGEQHPHHNHQCGRAGLVAWFSECSNSSK